MTDEQLPPEEQIPNEGQMPDEAAPDEELVEASAAVAIEDEELHVDKYERNWLIVSAVTLGIFFLAVTVAGFALGIQVPTTEERIDPNTFTESPPWSDPGVRLVDEANQEYEVYMIARRYSFTPREITVPEGAKVTFYVTSADVQHGMKMFSEDARVNINFMIIPGQVSKQAATFDTPGIYEYVCHEYCGENHHLMWGRLTVEPTGGE